MFWIVQTTFLDREPKYGELIDQLGRQATSFAKVQKVPFSNSINPDVVADNPVFVVGGTSMREVSKIKGWSPGYIDENLNYRFLLEHYGEHMLNKDAVIAPLKDIKYRFQYGFFRPAGDGKAFAGQAMSWAQFIDWRDKIYGLQDGNSYTSIKPEDEVVYSSLADIRSEYRFFVIGGKVATYSLYKIGGRVRYDATVDQYLIDYAQKIADMWCPNKAFALDLALTDEGPKVLEINSISSAGFYACDMGKFVAAINALEQ